MNCCQGYENAELKYDLGLIAKSALSTAQVAETQCPH